MNPSEAANLKRKVTTNKNNEPTMKAPKLTMKTDERVLDLKSMKKSDLIHCCENLLKQNQDLIAENKKLTEMNAKYVDEMSTLETSVKELKDKCANTPVYLCGDCDYLADCIHDFNDHTHSPEDFNESDLHDFRCNFCEETFDVLSEVMKHNKEMHSSHVQHCNRYLEDQCYYGENC